MLISLLIFIALIYIVVLVTLYLYQDRLLFIGAKPGYLAYIKLENDTQPLISNNHLLQGWKVECKSSNTDIVAIYFGGNAEDTSNMLSVLKKLTINSAYTFNYRGYGLSEGYPSEQSIYQDALTIYQHVINNSPGHRIVVIGHSLGSAVAGYLASKRNIHKLILLSPLSSVPDIIKIRFKNLIPKALVKNKFELNKLSTQITAETLVIIALSDSIIPNHHSLNTYEKISSNKKLIEISNANHNNLLSFDCTIGDINLFIHS